MKKIWTVILAALLVVPFLQQTQVQAATPISVYINGSHLATDQAPVMVGGRVMLPLRSIFEALGATVKWNQVKKIVTANKGGITIVLPINSKTATVNNKAVTLDVPARVMNGRTLVPVRFVSESLGQKVGWDNYKKIVTITTPGAGSGSGDVNPSPVNYVTLRDVGNYGDGRDLQVSFSKSSNEARVDHYRIMIVKAANASGFSLSAATKIPSGNYTTYLATGSDPAITLSSNSRDVDGALITANQSYAAFVLAVGKAGSQSALSSASPVITLINGSSVDSATNVRVTDVSDYGDGRDMSVSFTRPSGDSNIANYRVLVVKTKDAGSFSLTTANSVPSSYSTVVYKSGSSTTLTSALTSSSRDTSGELIKNGVPYTVFVLSVSSNTSTAANKLSIGSYSLTLGGNSVTAPVITQVQDVGNNGDGRDLQYSFNKISDESRISAYRIFVVKASNYYNFDLAKANAVYSSNYTQINKTGYNITNQTLAYGARDTDGDTIRNGVSYRLFVMAVGSGSYAGTNALSSASSAITLSNSYGVGTISNLTVSDVNNYGDGRDLRVSFTRATDESNISYYRIYVVKSSYAGSFDLADANASNYYTTVYKNGTTLTQTLTSSTRDVDGALIQSGVSYRVFVLSVNNDSYSGNNALSSYSSAITLGSNYGVGTISNLTVSDVSDYGDGRDLRVSFTRASDETNISSYRIFVVKSYYAGSFDLADANASGYYTTVYKNGTTLTQTLSSSTRDVDGSYLQNGVGYQVFVLSVGNSSYYGNSLSSYSSVITLSSNSSVAPASNVVIDDISDYGNGQDLRVSFNRASDETNIGYYRILVVPANVGSFDLNAANAVSSGNYTDVSKTGGNISRILNNNANDVNGAKIQNGVNYRVYILSIGSGSYAGRNAISSPSASKTLTGNSVPVSPATNVRVNVDVPGNGNGGDVVVNFKRASDETNISEYRILVVPSTQGFGLADANNVKDNYIRIVPNGLDITQRLSAATKDVNNNTISLGQAYRVFVLAVADGRSATVNALSTSSGEFQFNAPVQQSVPGVSGVTAAWNQNVSGFDINFTPVQNSLIEHYEVLVVQNGQTFDLAAANTAAVNSIFEINPNSVNLPIEVNKDAFGHNIVSGTYQVYVLSVAQASSKASNSLSGPTTITAP